MGDIIDNSSLKPNNGTGTTPVSGQQEQRATQTTEQTENPGTQTTEQSQAPATQTTDANQASGGEGNAGVSQQNSDAAAAQGTGQSVVGNGTTVPTGDGTTQTGNGTTQQVVADGSTQPVTGEGTTTPPAAATPTYLADWGNTTFMDAVKSGNKSIADYMRDYNKWATANNQDPLDIYTMMQAINGNDIGESYAENEKAQRRLKRQQTWEQIGNVLAHLGNFVGTLAGAPSATYETGPQLTARQQAVRDAVEKQRGDPKNILAQIWKDRADQRARELNNANVALQGARKANVEGQTVNQKAQSDATVALRGAQQHQAETAAQENQARADYVTGQNDRAEELQPLKKANIRSSTNANNARANASNASAESSRATASKTRSAAGRLSKEAEADKDFYSLYNSSEGRKYIDQYATNNHLDVGNNTSGMLGGGSWSNKNNRIAAVKWARSKMQGRKSTGVAWKKSTKKISLGMHWKKSK